jgi:CTP synthase (UTP-ammonia lyase)
LGIADADHEESSPDASVKLISKLTCSLSGQEGMVRITPGTLSHQIYGKDEVLESFACNYGLNESFADQIGQRDLKISGRDEDGTVRIVELPGHTFYIATLFVPQVTSKPGAPHPMIVAYLRAAADFRKASGAKSA